MKGFMCVTWLAVSAICSSAGATQLSSYWLCEECRSTQTSLMDYGNHGFNMLFGELSFLTEDAVIELLVINPDDEIAYVRLELLTLPFQDVWDENPDYEPITNEWINVVVVDPFDGRLLTYSIDYDLAGSLGPLPVGDSTAPTSSGSSSTGGSGSTDGAGSSGGAGFGTGSGSDGGSGGGGNGGGVAGCSVSHTDTETILVCYVN